MQAVENLKEAEFREQQAVAIVETIRDAQVEFATKDDLRFGLEKLELVLRTEIGSLRSEMHTEIGSLRSEMRTEIGGLRSEMRTETGGLRGEISELRNEMQTQFATMYWRFLIGAGVIAGISGTIATFVVTLAGGNHS